MLGNAETFLSEFRRGSRPEIISVLLRCLTATTTCKTNQELINLPKYLQVVRSDEQNSANIIIY
mgnify:CR=1 FL=1